MAHHMLLSCNYSGNKDEFEQIVTSRLQPFTNDDGTPQTSFKLVVINDEDKDKGWTTTYALFLREGNKRECFHKWLDKLRESAWPVPHVPLMMDKAADRSKAYTKLCKVKTQIEAWENESLFDFLHVGMASMKRELNAFVNDSFTEDFLSKKKQKTDEPPEEAEATQKTDEPPEEAEATPKKKKKARS